MYDFRMVALLSKMYLPTYKDAKKQKSATSQERINYLTLKYCT